ncbi:adenosylcobyric acid synthase [Aerococcus agrisoli]|uniref:Lipid II isoglutaminyl synthase (glutamine-hydrolyzing) subunit GatD n=1 Tax=Aerococcus agrisoli TaxID=2487350 RepID=A0A3N4GL24_9LACT|nr:adenosylcobyric acid synthase [Aerococcus agrisoli]RPA59821.1 adenosylcobyric acid synthase [Aerococcus agrisoli]
MTRTLKIAHLYGNLMNTYGDNGNLLMLEYEAKQQDVNVETELVSVGDEFDPNKYDLVFFGGGQDYEQKIVARDIQLKKEALTSYIENYGVTIGICGGFQLLGKYYINAAGERLEGIGALDHYTLNQDNNRFIGDIVIENERFGQTYYGYENHNGRTFLGENTQALGKVVTGFGNNGEDQTEGVMYKNTFGSYFHGPLLVRNDQLTKEIVALAIQNMDARLAKENQTTEA